MAAVIWLTGMSGAGKTMLVSELEQEFVARGQRVQELDGDVVREIFEDDLGYDRAARIMNVRRIAFAAMMLAENGVNALVANIAPFYEARDFIRRITPVYFQVYVQAALETLKERDTKGLYGGRTGADVGNVIGVDEVYDTPRNPDLIVDTDRETVAGTAARIIERCEAKGLL